ncbi:elongation of very long chain fatty acids protein AAEL008004-like [Anthonomus grandis grandis]|uniref:elongation of very long chain fatty acids protein AAEL008004-like n=1 Tax=Anthonomus grandis grandis TaxID=2921223 RepID=UPI002165B553|nr:elongation of very long chain fatty acids protein AAEL008004-like [Anthonomus grandis grandis]
MATVAEYIYDIIEEKSDKRVSDWVFMSSSKPTIAIIVIYLALIYLILPSYMKNRKPYDLTSVIRAYNIFQILSCITLIYWIATSGWVQGEYSLGCQPIDYSNNPKALSLLQAFHWTYFLKITELVETVFFVLRKKFNQVSNLHVYHHASTVALAWFGCKFIGGGMASLPIMLNSFIHILMYLYYYLASLGPKWQKRLSPWKPRLTIAQMVQFTLLIIHAIGFLQPSCDAPRVFVMFYLPNVVLIYKMFYDFYKKSYNNKQKQA